MSVENIMKINKLAQELLVQGIAKSRDEAVIKAQNMLNQEAALQGLDKIKENKSYAAAQNEAQEESVKNRLDRMQEYNDKRFEAYKNALVGLEKEITELKKIVSTPARLLNASSETRASDAPSERKFEQREIKKKESHPRSGNYNSNDVSVEKIFYYGNK